jgi:hypothetical protein
MPKQLTQHILSKNIFTGKISNPCQVGGIETSVMDNGGARGVRIAWVNTGSGFRYKVVLDRAMDIADAFFNSYSIGWMNKTGIVPPQPFTEKGLDWLRTFGGGLLITCGLSHVGGPEKDENGDRGLHGLISNNPAEIISIVQPDPENGKMEMSITAIVRETKIFGPSLYLKRTISGTLGKSYLHIHDEITNVGNTDAAHMLLYHFNFGWPLVDEGSELVFNGDMHLVNESRPSKIFNESNNYRVCPAPLHDHNGTGEDVAYFDIKENDKGECISGIYNENIGLAVSLSFKKNQLKCLTNWQHFATGEYVTGIEPGTHPPIGQARARKENSLLFIQPGETKSYDVRMDVIEDEEGIHQFLKNRS